MTAGPASGSSGIVPDPSSASPAYTLSRVETNQRALIDKILARYATQNAVYRELLQNSNDAGAKQAEIRFTTTAATANGASTGTSAAAAASAGMSVRQGSSTEKACKRPLVTKVLYRNDGMPFRDEDWARLSKIAEGNPDPSKVGAFGVGAYTMFSVCEQPMVVSSDKVLMFVWKGDALWTQVGPIPADLEKTLSDIDAQSVEGGAARKGTKWTTFVLDSRDLYAVPSMVSLGQFLASSLTFTRSLHTIRVYVDDKLEMTLSKQATRAPKEIEVASKSQGVLSSMGWSRSGDGGTVTSSSNGIFTLGSPSTSSTRSIAASARSGRSTNSSSSSGRTGIMESLTRLTVTVGGESSSVDARYISAPVTTKISKDMAKRMERVTKKKVPAELRVEVFLAAGASEVDGTGGGSGADGGSGKAYANSESSGVASAITSSFAPSTGTGKIFIGFQTSQTTGLAAHVSAPFVPTVEREAIDLVDPTLRAYNSELLQISGMVLRLGLERAMQGVSERFEAMHEVYLAEDEALIKEARAKKHNSIEEQKEEQEEDKELTQTTSEDTTVSKSLMSFAKYMAKGVKSTIVSAAKTIDEIVSNDEDELIRPLDPRPLSFEEREAILLMRSFCAKPSTPDADIGIAIADGFTRVMPVSPPVLTRTGVVRGNDARLPKDGLEAYIHQNVVRRVVLENASEYHEFIAQCMPLKMGDLSAYIQEHGIFFEEYEFVRFLKWWVKFNRMRPCYQYGPLIKRHISFSQLNATEPKSLDKIYYFRERNIFTDDDLPMPDSVLALSLQESIGTRMLEDASLRSWFSPLPVDVWASFISQQPIMTQGLVSDAEARSLVLSMLSKEYRKHYRYGKAEGSQFEALTRNLLSDKRCIPFEDPKGKAKTTTDFPTELYLSSASLEAFSGVSSFRKVSPDLKDAGVSDDFLLALGVRKSVSVEFLFSNLDKLKWSENPKALIDYLRSATLTSQDMENLRSMAYLPALNDKSRTFAPSELYFGGSDLSGLNLPFIRLIQWPSDDKLSAESADGKFLIQLGCRVDPPLQPFLQYLSSQSDLTDEKRLHCLSFITKRLQPGGAYDRVWAKSSASFRKIHFLPSARKDPFGDGTLVKELRAPGECYSDPACQVMGFIILDPEVDRKSGRTYGASFQLVSKPSPQLLLKRMLEIVLTAKMLLEHAGQDDEATALRKTILLLFEQMFSYLSSRSSDFAPSHMKDLQRESFVPCKSESGSIGWHRPGNVYFKHSEKEEDEVIALLFHSVGFSPFLAAAGVKSEASVQDILRQLVSKPREVLQNVGVDKYTNLLHRIASEPIKTVSAQIRQAPFLLAYQQQEEDKDGDGAEAVATPVLAKAQDIYLIDNSFFGRMFPVLSAPHETDLEALYYRFGSRYISESVKKSYRIIGQQHKSTALTREFARRLKERKSLLISPKNTSRPLVDNAARLLDERTLQIVQCDAVQAIYSLGDHDKVQNVTCCSNKRGRWAVTLCVTKDLDFFDVGSAVGDLILQRCELEDAFLLSNLLEAPLDTLRARGFAVDRAVKVKEYRSPPKEKVVAPTVVPIPPPKSADSTSQPDETKSNGESACGDKAAHSADSPTGANDMMNSRLAELAQSAAASSAAAAASAAHNRPAPPAAPAPENKPDSSLTNQSEDSDVLRSKKRRGLRKLLGSRGGSSNKFPGDASSHTAGSATTGMSEHVPPSHVGRGHDDDKPVSPEADASSHEQLRGMLASSLSSSRGTASSGINSPEKLMTELPEGLGRGDDGCEIIPSQSLQIFGRTTNGIKVFSSLKHGGASESFLKANVRAVKTFSSVLETLCEVYSLNIHSVAIYYEPSGNTIAFNSNKALYFNLRFFSHLHYQEDGPLSSECYSYWFTTMAHELAHNLVSAHNKDHGYYTESYVTLFLPALSAKLQRIGIR